VASCSFTVAIAGLERLTDDLGTVSHNFGQVAGHHLDWSGIPTGEGAVIMGLQSFFSHQTDNMAGLEKKLSGIHEQLEQATKAYSGLEKKLVKSFTQTK
jgi:hypothetical protein